VLSPFKAPSGVRARDGRELRDTERAAFAKCMHFAKRCGQASVEDVCKEWEISKSHGYRILNRWRTEESVLSRPRSGRPRALTEEDMKTLESLSEEVNGYFVVFVQMDNARPHVKRKTHLEVAGKRRKRINGKQMPLIKFVLQPANSPDTNLNDLCFFRSLLKFARARTRDRTQRCQ
jgi:transposase